MNGVFDGRAHFDRVDYGPRSVNPIFLLTGFSGVGALSSCTKFLEELELSLLAFRESWLGNNLFMYLLFSLNQLWSLILGHLNWIMHLLLLRGFDIS